MIVLGVSYTHNSGACVLKDGEILSCINEERLNRIKLYGHAPYRSIEQVIKLAGIEPGDIDVVALADMRPLHFVFRQVRMGLKNLVNGVFIYPGIRSSVRRNKKIRAVKKYLQALGVNSEYEFVEHHTAHAAGAYFTSGFEEALVVTCDGEGDSLSATVSICSEGEIERVGSTDMRFSPGMFYGQVTQALGFKFNRHEGKITGLAAYGNPEAVNNSITELITLREDGYGFAGKISEWYSQYGWWKVAEPLKQICKNHRREDVAAAFQKRLEDVMASHIEKMLEKHRIEDLALSGGVFANVKLNQRIHNLGRLGNIFIHPAMGDEGLSLGAALYVYAKYQKQHGGEFLPFRLEHAYFGPEFSSNEIERTLQQNNLEYEKARSISKEIAELLVEDNSVVARFNGKMEYGPRALGNRSILALPTDPTINDWLNERLERTEFMPFAPSILADAVPEFYRDPEGAEYTAEFMTITFDVTEHGKKNAPAAVHVDSTSRPQIVTNDANPDYRETLEKVRDASGLPIVLNTSFNMHEEPIVCTPYDAVRSFLQGHLDALAIGDFLVRPAED